MKKLKRRAKFVPGATPGTVLEVEGSAKPRIFVIAYKDDEEIEAELDDPSEIQPLLDSWPVVWVEVRGLGDKEMLQAIARTFGITDLALEKVANQNQRPKFEDTGNMVHVVASLPHMSDDVFESKQLDLFVRNGLVVSFLETDYGWFEPVKERIRNPENRFRQHETGYLLYALLDAAVDHYFPILHDTADRLYELEERIFEDESYEILSKVNRERRNLFEMHRALEPSFDTLKSLQKKVEFKFLDALEPFIHDLRDHIVMAMDAVAARRETARALIDMVMSVSNHRMSETMKVLTIIATIFIPLSFIAGVFGMNFDTDVSPFNMPELKWKYGYFAALGLMALVATGLAVFFKRKKWFGDK